MKKKREVSILKNVADKQVDKIFTFDKGRELPAEHGVIPRAVCQIFDTLEAQNADYSMKVTFLEHNNEEIVKISSHRRLLKIYGGKAKEDDLINGRWERLCFC
ncbi:ATP binding microtubule motor family protein [Artemisia annua]|uniref:ATP binding microtubule motor family protein n=1 Tax=Artemisia annua TaxID=35608 RepID=A0A2U1KID6_ARTAN|nr:ATP binding microtubule motor family protein [Artemisia annua]